MTLARLRIRWLPAVAVAAALWAAPAAFGQTAPPPPPPIAGESPLASTGTTKNPNVYPSYVRPQAHYQQHRRSVVQHYPYPYPGYYHGDETAGFRNPSGAGRYAEYYPAGDRFQVENDPVRTARFDQGGGAPDRSEQLAAEQIGIQRGNSIQGHIDNYARPAFGYGFGVGGFGGFW
ncbi:hypothetical protein [Paludisphaera borealis]|uniref:Uncharacterized protein n=1 Tax=Paludisphaera borealis TaxID=1387353 RepID=A0A1U7CWN2_9BACT|nr:hypothetical protein [Paludisphaera borealis]APW63345.1 hypothetical protein BSF38_04909 [Paludisphaera borealis]